MKRIIAILALFCLASMSFAATRIVLTGSKTQTYTDLDTCFTEMGTGDTVDIQEFDGPLTLTVADNFNGWSTLKCTAAQPATILCDVALGWLDHQTIENIIFDGQGKTANLFGWGVASTVTNCTIKNFTWDAVHLTRGGDGGVGVTFSNCYFYNNNVSLGFAADNIDASVTNINKTIIDHCTIVANKSENAPISVDGNFAGKDLFGIFSLRNSIVSGAPGATAIRYGGGILTNAATQVDEDYNLLDGWWHVFYSEGNDPGHYDQVVGAHSVKVDVRNADYFVDFANENYRINVASPAYGAGQGGSNIGADLTQVNVFVVKNGATVKATVETLQAALAAAQKGDTIDITSYKTPIDVPGSFTLDGVNLICSAAGPAVMNFTGAPTAGCFASLGYVMVCGGATLQNIKLVGTADDATDTAWGPIFMAGKATVDHCIMTGFSNSDIYLFNYMTGTSPFDGTQLDVTISNTYVYGNGSKDWAGAIQMSDFGGTANAPTSEPKVKVDHCTFVTNGPVFYFNTQPTMDSRTDMSYMTVQNTIAYNTAGGAICWAQKNAIAKSFNEDHNAFITTDSADHFFKFNDDATDPQNPVQRYATVTLNPYSLFNATAPVFTSATDLTLKAGDSANYQLSKRGRNGQNIGADTTTDVPVELSSFHAE